MNSLFLRKLEMLTRARDYGAAHKPLFEMGFRGAQLFDELATVITELQTLSSTQSSAITSAREITTFRSLARRALVECLEAISLSAKSLAVRSPGLKDKFRPPRKVGDQVLLAHARAFAKDAVPLKPDFIALEMPADFIESLEASIAAFEAILTKRHTTRHSKSATTASMEGVLNRGVLIVQELQAVVQNKVRTDEGLMTAWKRATRIERPRRSRGQAAGAGDQGPEPAVPPTPAP